MKDIKTTNTLLLIIVIPLIFYLLKILSFIFIPLILSMFIAILFLPLIRWMDKVRMPRVMSIVVVILIIFGILKLGGFLIKLSSNEILSAKDVFIEKAESKLLGIIVTIENFFGIERVEGENVLIHYFQKSNVMKNFGKSLDFIGDALSMTLMTVFFVILLLSESINFEKILNSTLLKSNYSSVKTFMKIERDLIKFIKVKFIISLLTGIGFSIACIAFGISFPIFWGLFAFLINFVQLVGSIISVVLCALFALVELDPSGTLLLFVLSITMVQVLMGGVLEPIFMGKTFSVNVMTVLIMLMLWGFIWGVPGLIMSIPITVFMKIIFEQFPETKKIAALMSGSEQAVKIPWKKKT